MSEMPAISLTGVKSCARSSDGSAVHVTFTTKYTGDYPVSMSRACVDQLLAALGAAPAPAEPAAAAPKPAAAAPAKTPDPKASAKPGQIEAHVPKKWAIASDLKVHDVVLLLFDPQTEAQKVFALGAEAAKQMAGHLAQSADAVLAHKQAKKNPSAKPS